MSILPIYWPHELKVQRAAHHLEQLKGLVGGWVEGKGYTTWVHPNPNPPRYIVKARILDDPDDDALALLTGDFLQNARSALDYIAQDLGNLGAGGWMPEDIMRRTSFPIVGDRDSSGFEGRGADMFADAARDKLATVPATAIEAIEQLQPYYTGAKTWNWEWLWVLNEFARIDRHRFPHFTIVHTGALDLDRTRSRNVRMAELNVSTGPFSHHVDIDEESAEVTATLGTFTARPTDPKRKMHMYFTSPLTIGFDPDWLPDDLRVWADSPIDFTMGQILNRVRQVVRTLTPFLPAKPPSR